MKILLDEDECGCYNKRVSEAQINFIWRHSQVVRQRSAKPSFPGSNPGGTSSEDRRSPVFFVSPEDDCFLDCKPFPSAL